MECKQIRPLMSAYLDQELDATQASQVDMHVAGCQDCSAALSQMQAVKTGVKQHAHYHTAPAGLRQKIMADLAQQHLSNPSPSPSPSRPSRLRAWPWAWINLGLAGMSTAAFAVMLVLYLGQPSANDIFNEDVLSSHFRSLAPGHLIDVASSDQHTVKPWYAGKLDFSPPVRDLAAQGYPLLGGRLDYLAGRQVAALVYQHRKHIVSLYLYPDNGQSLPAPTTASSRGYQLMQWSAAGMHYVAVSDMNHEEMAQFASQVRASAE
ncbi:anti-sigma factor family protein [Undibacterium sp. TJN19]|uniref:anti-sigma factor family protein n=1 Tax=Undibacterium sp. TJN19 TaxID=3413055 RepID=UPI003BF194EA